MIDITLHPKQTEFYMSPARFKVAVAGRRAGKTFLAGVTIASWSQTPMRGVDIYYVAPDKNQGVEIAWDAFLDLFGDLVIKTNVNNAVMFLKGTIMDRHGIPRQGVVKVKFKGANDPDSLRGKGLRAAVLDEFADMKAEAWEVCLRPTLSDYLAPAMFIGTPKGRNHFFRLCEEAKADKTGTWEFFKFTTLDNPHIDPLEIDQARRDLSTYAFAQEYLAEFDTGQSDLFLPEWIRPADKIPKHFTPMMAVDLAGYEVKELLSRAKNRKLDDAAIAVAYGEGDLRIVKEVILGRWTTSDTAKLIVRTAKENGVRRFGIEKGLAFQAIADTIAAEMRIQGWPMEFVELTHSNQHKTRRIVDTLQGHMEHGRLQFLNGGYLTTITDQFLQFPSPHAKDDGIDAISMLYQLEPVRYVPLSADHYVDDSVILDDITGH